MRPRSLSYPMRTVNTTTVKSSGAVSQGIAAPVGFRDNFVIFADQLNGDYKTVYAHSFRKDASQDMQGSIFRDTPVETFTQTGRIQGIAVQTLPNSNSLRNHAIGSLYEKLRSGEVGSGLDLSVDIAEASQVRRMLAQSVKVVNFVRRFHPRHWADRWLEYQYGWKPLVGSVYGTVDALMHRRLYTYQRIFGTGYDTSHSYGSQVGPLDGLLQGWHVWNKVRYKIVAEFDMSNTIKQRLGGYTSLNPVTVAWELVPYSFVVDWFIDIGGYLRNMETALAYGQKSFVRGFEVHGYISRKEAYVSVDDSEPITGMFVGGRGKGFRNYTFKSRVPMGVYPIPTLPSFKANLGWKQMISAASLLSQHVDGYSVWKRRGELLPDNLTRRVWVDPRIKAGVRGVLHDVRMGARNPVQFEP